jgi:hypothetical protein
MHDAMKMTPGELAKAVREIENENRRAYIGRRDAADIAKINAAYVPDAWQKLSADERKIIEQGRIKEIAEREAARALEAEREKFWSGLQKKYGQ